MTSKKLMLAEIIDSAIAAKTSAEAVAILQGYDSVALRSILNVGLNPNVNLALPEGNPPFTPSQFEQENQFRLFSEYRKLHYLVEPKASELAPLNRERIFIGLLESLPKEEAALLLRMKNKQLGIEPTIVREAFPGLL